MDQMPMASRRVVSRLVRTVLSTFMLSWCFISSLHSEHSRSIVAKPERSREIPACDFSSSSMMACASSTCVCTVWLSCALFACCLCAYSARMATMFSRSCGISRRDAMMRPASSCASMACSGCHGSASFIIRESIGGRWLGVDRRRVDISVAAPPSACVRARAPLPEGPLLKGRPRTPVDGLRSQFKQPLPLPAPAPTRCAWSLRSLTRDPCKPTK
mmetsp:Transcript_51071/g.163398  ORF Transcript_51071/g.163398 Transcript_51071/m.163398 type:complete len:216 (+) Transcript_51071:289-936(+)